MAIPHYQFAVRNVHQSFRGLAASAELYSKDRSKLQDTGGHFLGEGKDSWRIFLQSIWYTIEGLFLGTPQITVCKGLTGGVIFDQIHQGCGNLGTHDITGGVRRNRSNKPCEAYMRTHMSQRETHWMASPLYHGFILCRNRVYEVSWSLPAGDFLTFGLSVDVYFRPWDQFRYLFRRVLLFELAHSLILFSIIAATIASLAIKRRRMADSIASGRVLLASLYALKASLSIL